MNCRSNAVEYCAGIHTPIIISRWCTTRGLDQLQPPVQGENQALPAPVSGIYRVFYRERLGITRWLPRKAAPRNARLHFGDLVQDYVAAEKNVWLQILHHVLVDLPIGKWLTRRFHRFGESEF